MDYEVVWSPAALEDVESLAEYIARDSEFYARAVVNKILDSARKLQGFPPRVAVARRRAKQRWSKKKKGCCARKTQVEELEHEK